jgi:hypothetical protein
MISLSTKVALVLFAITTVIGSLCLDTQNRDKTRICPGSGRRECSELITFAQRWA